MSCFGKRNCWGSNLLTKVPLPSPASWAHGEVRLKSPETENKTGAPFRLTVSVDGLRVAAKMDFLVPISFPHWSGRGLSQHSTHSYPGSLSPLVQVESEKDSQASGSWAVQVSHLETWTLTTTNKVTHSPPVGSRGGQKQVFWRKISFYGSQRRKGLFSWTEVNRNSNKYIYTLSDPSPTHFQLSYLWGSPPLTVSPAVLPP